MRRRIRYLYGYLGLFIRTAKVLMPIPKNLKPLRKLSKFGVNHDSKSIIENFSGANHSPAKKLVLGLPKLVTRSGRWMEFDFHYVFSSYQLDNPRAEIDSLLIVYSWTPKSIDAQTKQQIQLHRQSSSKRVIAVLGDVLEENCIELLSWLEIVDGIVHFNPNLTSHSNDMQRRILVWPGLPFPENKFFDIQRNEKKSIKLLFAGSNHRNRGLFDRYLKYFKVAFDDISHGRDDGNSVEVCYEDFLRKIASHQLLFSNGYKNQHESILVGKVLESVLLGTTVLYEEGSWIDKFFTPYVHYVPVKNAFDLARKVRFLQKRPEVAHQIASNALEHYLLNYSSKKFWKEVEAMIRIKNIH